MAHDVYRRAYRVERRTRDLSPAEVALVAGRLREWQAQVRAGAFKSAHELLVPLGVGLVFALIGAVRGNRPLLIAGGIMAAFLGCLLVMARRNAGKTVAASRGPWHPPEAGWKVCETLIAARSVVGAVSGDEDYALWLLFEVPGGPWFFVDPACLPGRHGAEDLARASVRMTRLVPNGRYLGVELDGDAIPRHGASGAPDEYSDDMNAGHVWRPDEADPDAEGLIPEAKLPAWVRAAAGG